MSAKGEGAECKGWAQGEGGVREAMGRAISELVNALTRAKAWGGGEGARTNVIIISARAPHTQAKAPPRAGGKGSVGVGDRRGIRGRGAVWEGGGTPARDAWGLESHISEDCLRFAVRIMSRTAYVSHV